MAVESTRDTRQSQVLANGLAQARRELDGKLHLVAARSNAAAPPTFRPASSLPFAQALLKLGDDDARREAHAIIGAVLDSQERDPTHPYFGNFLWLADDLEVGDLNAVQFVMRELLPIVVRYRGSLPLELIERCRTAIELALQEEERLNVAPTYTNIHLMSLFALIVGAEWLEDPTYLALGRERWAKWVRFTIDSGAPHEYASPGYAAVDLSALAELANLVRDPLVRLQANLLYERLWIHVALHLHQPTGQFVGPHCRAYWPAMMTGQAPVKEQLWLETGWPWTLEPGPYGGNPAEQLPGSIELALTDGWLPDIARNWLENQEKALPCEIRETSNAAEGHDLVHYMTGSYSLGTASRTYGIGQDDFYIEHHSNYMMLHYARPKDRGGWGMMYSRYVVNDQHWGTKAAAPDRSKESNFFDFGNFAGIQFRNKAIGLYALQAQTEEVFSLKTIVVFPAANQLEEIWIDNQRVDLASLPLTVTHDRWLIVGDGSVYIGLRPLEPSRLGRDTPILLERGPGNELWLTMYNYRGAPKRFWDYASLHGAFWHGNLKAGFVTEVVERSLYPDAASFCAHLRQSEIVDETDDRKLRTVSYRSGGEEISLEYDLWRTEPGQRRVNGEEYEPPALDSPIAVHGSTGRLQVGKAIAHTAAQPMWMFAQELDPASQFWVLVNPENRSTHLRWETPCGVIEASRFGLGRLEWRAPESGAQTLLINALVDPADLRVPPGVAVQHVRQ